MLLVWRSKAVNLTKALQNAHSDIAGSPHFPFPVSQLPPDKLREAYLSVSTHAGFVAEFREGAVGALPH